MSDFENFSPKKSDNPEDLLLERLLRQERELLILSEINKKLYDLTGSYQNLVEEIIENMMEPIILQEIIDIISDNNYKEYLRGGMSVINYYKMEKLVSDLAKQELLKKKGEL